MGTANFLDNNFKYKLVITTRLNNGKINRQEYENCTPLIIPTYDGDISQHRADLYNGWCND